MKSASILDTQKVLQKQLGTLQNGGVHICGGDFCLYCKTGDKKICEEYKKEANIQNKMRHEKFDAYTAKETLRYQGGKSYILYARGEKGEAKT